MEREGQGITNLEIALDIFSKNLKKRLEEFAIIGS